MQLSNLRILYIEDHDDTRELVTIILRQNDYDVITGTTIEDGIHLAKSGAFDLYLLDSWLPDGSGLDLCKRIREFDPLTPILFYSAAAYEADRAEALESGAQGYLVKPSQTSDLCSLVSQLIETRPSALAATRC
jgi:DNA-binding response OmpR family regulator